MRFFSLLMMMAAIVLSQNATLGQVAGPSSEALAVAGERSTGVLVRGIELGDLRGLELSGAVNPADFSAGHHAVIARHVADALGVDVGDPFTLVDPTGTKSSLGVTPKVMEFTVAAIAAPGTSNVANTAVYLSRKNLEALSGVAFPPAK